MRLTEFPGADLCACCGTHVSGSGQVGLVKFLSCQKFREGVRLEILCGSRAYRYLSQVYDQDRAVAQLLSVNPRTPCRRRTAGGGAGRMVDTSTQIVYRSNLFSLDSQKALFAFG